MTPQACSGRVNIDEVFMAMPAGKTESDELFDEEVSLNGLHVEDSKAITEWLEKESEPDRQLQAQGLALLKATLLGRLSRSYTWKTAP